MKHKSPKPHLLHISDSIERIERNTPKTKDEFFGDMNAQDATLMRLQDIGEQLARLRDNFPDFFDSHASDDWHRIIGLRNIISHGYREIDFEIIWQILENNLDKLDGQIKGLL